MARIFTAKYLLQGDASPLVGGALLDLDGRIVAIGPLADLQRSNPGVELVDFGETVIAPLLVNAHTHLELTDYPIWAQQVAETDQAGSFVDWILRLIRVKRELKKKDYTRSLTNGIRQSLAAGTGAVGDILSQYPCRRAYRKCSLEGIIYLESLGHDPGLISKVKQELRSVLAEEQVGGMRLGLSPHSPYTISREYLTDIFEKCRRQSLPCSTHLAESSAEVDFLRDSSGDLADSLYPYVGWEYLLPRPRQLRPAEYLHRQHGLFPDNLLVHGVQLQSQEIELIAKQGCHLALCPRSNAKLDVGVAPVTALQAAGVKLCLGTDSLASNDSLSVWDEMAFARNWFDGALDAPSLWRLGTLDGAEALGCADRLGSLAVDKLSSFQLLQPESKIAEREFLDYLTTPGRTAEIRQVYHRGRRIAESIGALR